MVLNKQGVLVLRYSFHVGEEEYRGDTGYDTGAAPVKLFFVAPLSEESWLQLMVAVDGCRQLLFSLMVVLSFADNQGSSASIIDILVLFG